MVLLLLSPALIVELRDLLNRPALQAKSSRLTPDRADRFLELISQLAEHVSHVPDDTVGGVRGFVLHRGLGERRFGLRERNLLSLFHQELFVLFKEGRLTRRDRPEMDLTPRQRQVVELLLAGISEKQVAHELQISRHTVNDHIKAIYQRLGVNSRGELMARFVQPRL